MGKSLKQQMEELTKSQVPDFDIEDAERGVFEHEEDSGSEAEDDEELKREHYVKVGKSKLRENGIEIKDPKYKGKNSSRKAIFDESSGDEDEKESDIEESHDDEAFEEESEEESQESEHEEEVFGELESASSEDEEDQNSAVSLTDSEEEHSDSESEPETDNEDNIKRNKLKQLMSQERSVILSRISTSTQIDALKGYAVISQQKQFDNIIDARIKLQKAVQGSNGLPLTNEAFDEFQEEESEDLTESATKSLHALLNRILSLRTKIFNKEKTTKEPLTFKSKKRTLEEFMDETSQLDTVLKKNRDQVLTKWSHKVQSASGAQALNASKFKTLNQGAAQQVDANLMDMDRLLKRTRLNRRNVVPLGRVEDDEEEQEMDRSLKEDRDVFDDEDFYRVLLNDLVSKKLADNAPSGGLILTKTKVKKHVDTKASKGRKLKYTVQEPLQNYEAPKGSFKWEDLQIDEFFAGLLGQKVDFAESDEDEELEEEREMLEEDGLKLFG